ncbi:glycoside hydrolase family 16 protein [Alkalispirochaeta americana]|nr:glycoside hydrolase family 16 protein [Alkalispirochaeta americana]
MDPRALGQTVLTGVVIVVFGTVAIPAPVAQPRTITFAGYEWTVRASAKPTAPGGNTFSSAPEDIWVDQSGHLNMTLGNHATEVRSRRPLGYGVYEARFFGRIDHLDPQAVFGFFTFELPSNHQYHREIDIEFSRWGNIEMTNMQFSVQPSAQEENRHRFNLIQEGLATTHRFVWQPGRVDFLSWHGHSDYPPEEHLVAGRFTVHSSVVPDARRERVYFNFWRYQGKPLQSSERELLVVTDFVFQSLEDLEGSLLQR